MATIVTRAGKGSPLTNNEVDANFVNLNNAKLEGTVAIANGGTGQTTQQAAINALAGAVTTAQYLRGNGTNVVMSAIQAADVPTLNQNTTGTAANVTGTVAIANGGTGQTSKTNAFDALSPTTTKGDLIVSDGTDNVRLAVGTNDYVLTADSTAASGVAWKAAAGGSTVLTISNKTAAYTVVAGDLGKIINCTANTFTVSLTAAATLGAGFNCWIWNTSTTATHAITVDPNASETIDGQTTIVLRAGEGMQVVCDGTNWITGDKKTMRGYAESLSGGLGRASASGGNSVAIGASRASGSSSFAAGQQTSSASYSASGGSSLAVGHLSNSTGTNSVAVGYGTTATAAGATAIGAGAEAIAAGAIGIGQCQAYGARSMAIGFFSKAIDIGKYAFAGGVFTNFGDAQTGQILLLGTTTSATPLVLTSDKLTAGASNQAIIQNNSAHHFRISVVGRQRGDAGTAIASYEFTGLLRRASGEATTTILASTKTVVFETTAGWDCAISADTTNGALAVTVTGATSVNIRWIARVETVEINAYLDQ
jgi:hypothetical protein